MNNQRSIHLNLINHEILNDKVMDSTNNTVEIANVFKNLTRLAAQRLGSSIMQQYEKNNVKLDTKTLSSDTLSLMESFLGNNIKVAGDTIKKNSAKSCAFALENLFSKEAELSSEPRTLEHQKLLDDFIMSLHGKMITIDVKNVAVPKTIEINDLIVTKDLLKELLILDTLKWVALFLSEKYAEIGLTNNYKFKIENINRALVDTIDSI